MTIRSLAWVVALFVGVACAPRPSPAPASAPNEVTPPPTESLSAAPPSSGTSTTSSSASAAPTSVELTPTPTATATATTTASAPPTATALPKGAPVPCGDKKCKPTEWCVTSKVIGGVAPPPGSPAPVSGPGSCSAKLPVNSPSVICHVNEAMRQVDCTGYAPSAAPPAHP